MHVLGGSPQDCPFLQRGGYAGYAAAILGAEGAPAAAAPDPLAAAGSGVLDGAVPLVRVLLAFAWGTLAGALVCGLSLWLCAPGRHGAKRERRAERASVRAGRAERRLPPHARAPHSPGWRLLQRNGAAEAQRVSRSPRLTPEQARWQRALSVGLWSQVSEVLTLLDPERSFDERVLEIVRSAGGAPEGTPDQSSMCGVALKADGDGVPFAYRDALGRLGVSDVVRLLHARGGSASAAARQLARDLMWRARREAWGAARGRPGGLEAPAFRGVPQRLLESGVFRICGRDRLSRPILYITARLWTPMVYAAAEEEAFAAGVMDAIVASMDGARGDLSVYEDGTPPGEQWLAIFDLRGFSRANASVAQVKRLIALLVHHYPDRLGCAVVLDAPFFFHAMWSIVQTFLEDVTKRKIRFVRTREELHPDLEELVAAEVLEESIGGTHARYPNVPPQAYRPPKGTWEP